MLELKDAETTTNSSSLVQDILNVLVLVLDILSVLVLVLVLILV